jgi:hypothetical protein
MSNLDPLSLWTLDLLAPLIGLVLVGTVVYSMSSGMWRFARGMWETPAGEFLRGLGMLLLLIVGFLAIPLTVYTIGLIGRIT